MWGGYWSDDHDMLPGRVVYEATLCVLVQWSRFSQCVTPWLVDKGARSSVNSQNRPCWASMILRMISYMMEILAYLALYDLIPSSPVLIPNQITTNGCYNLFNGFLPAPAAKTAWVCFNLWHQFDWLVIFNWTKNSALAVFGKLRFSCFAANIAVAGHTGLTHPMNLSTISRPLWHSVGDDGIGWGTNSQNERACSSPKYSPRLPQCRDAAAFDINCNSGYWYCRHNNLWV